MLRRAPLYGFEHDTKFRTTDRLTDHAGLHRRRRTQPLRGPRRTSRRRHGASHQVVRGRLRLLRAATRRVGGECRVAGHLSGLPGQPLSDAPPHPARQHRSTEQLSREPASAIDCSTQDLRRTSHARQRSLRLWQGPFWGQPWTPPIPTLRHSSTATHKRSGWDRQPLGVGQESAPRVNRIHGRVGSALIVRADGTGARDARSTTMPTAASDARPNAHRPGGCASTCGP